MILTLAIQPVCVVVDPAASDCQSGPDTSPDDL